MFPIRTKNRRGISVVITTLIILVSSVVLGTGVVFYGTSLFQTASQQQSIASQGVTVWVNATYTSGTGGPGAPISWGAASIRNNGDVLATVNTIQVRGVNIPFTSWYVDTDPIRVDQNFQAQFNYTENDANGNLKGSEATGAGLGPIGGVPPQNPTCVQDTVNNPPNMIVMQVQPTTSSRLCLAQQTAPVTLNPGEKMIVYYKIPLGLLSPVDSGATTTLNIFAGNVGGPTSVTVANP